MPLAGCPWITPIPGNTFLTLLSGVAALALLNAGTVNAQGPTVAAADAAPAGGNSQAILTGAPRQMFISLRKTF